MKVFLFLGILHFAQLNAETVDPKFQNPDTISERFAYNLAYAAQVIDRGHASLDDKQRFTLANDLGNFADYELENTGSKLIGEKASKVFVLSLGKFGLEETLDRVNGYIDKRMAKNHEVSQIKHDDIEELKDGKVQKEFVKIVKKAIEHAVKGYAGANPSKVVKK